VGVLGITTPDQARFKNLRQRGTARWNAVGDRTGGRITLTYPDGRSGAITYRLEGRGDGMLFDGRLHGRTGERKYCRRGAAGVKHLSQAVLPHGTGSAPRLHDLDGMADRSHLHSRRRGQT
jgi:hypothetical protein